MDALLCPQVSDCEGEPRTQHQECPYLRQASQTTWYPIEGYCLASEEGGLRVVTIAEFHELCTTPEHARCELYRRRHGRASAETDQQNTGGTA